MKKTNLKWLAGIAMVSIIAVGCKKNDDVITPPIDTPKADKIESMTTLVESLKETPQKFDVTLTKEETIITGKEGVTIKLNRGQVKDSLGKNVDTFTVKLNEYLSLNSMILNNIQTSSSNQLLVTGGSFDIVLEDANGSPLDLTGGVIATIPVKTNPDDNLNMNYYVGERQDVDGREVVDWTLGKGDFGMKDDLFTIYGIKKGLSNCDVLYDIAANNPTQFEAKIKGVTDHKKTTIWLFIKDFPSVVMLTQENADNTALQTYVNSIPKGLKGTLVAMHTDDNDYLKFGKLDIEVAGDDTFEIETDYGTQAQLKALLQSL